jgi:phosphate transport system substrate-binding protein
MLFAAALWSASAFAIAGESLTIGGSGSGMGTMRLLADEFSRQNPQVAVTVVTDMGSSGGIKAVVAGAIDLSVSSRDLKPQEASGARAIAYGKTPFVLISNAPARRVASLRELADIIAARKKQWDDGTPIRVVMQHPTDTDSVLLQSLSPELKEAVASYFGRAGGIVVASDGEASEAVEHTPGSLGTSTLAHVLTSGRRIQAVSLGGVSPSVQTLASGKYPFSKTVYIVTRPAPAEKVQRFIEFVQSPKGREILAATGHWAGAGAH